MPQGPPRDQGITDDPSGTGQAPCTGTALLPHSSRQAVRAESYFCPVPQAVPLASHIGSTPHSSESPVPLFCP